MERYMERCVDTDGESMMNGRDDDAKKAIIVKRLLQTTTQTMMPEPYLAEYDAADMSLLDYETGTFSSHHVARGRRRLALLLRAERRMMCSRRDTAVHVDRDFGVDGEGVDDE